MYIYEYIDGWRVFRYFMSTVVQRYRQFRAYSGTIHLLVPVKITVQPWLSSKWRESEWVSPSLDPASRKNPPESCSGGWVIQVPKLVIKVIFVLRRKKERSQGEKSKRQKKVEKVKKKLDVPEERVKKKLARDFKKKI